MLKEVRHFTDLKVWQKSHALFLVLVKDMEDIPRNKVYFAIADQVLRSVGAISANIAEGFNARTTKQYINFLDIAKRTTAESENWLYKLKDSFFSRQDLMQKRIDECHEISRMLSGLMKSLDRKRR